MMIFIKSIRQCLLWVRKLPRRSKQGAVLSQIITSTRFHATMKTLPTGGIPFAKRGVRSIPEVLLWADSCGRVLTILENLPHIFTPAFQAFSDLWIPADLKKAGTICQKRYSVPNHMRQLSPIIGTFQTTKL